MIAPAGHPSPFVKHIDTVSVNWHISAKDLFSATAAFISLNYGLGSSAHKALFTLHRRYVRMIGSDELFCTKLVNNLTLVEITKAKFEILSYVGPCVGKL